MPIAGMGTVLRHFLALAGKVSTVTLPMRPVNTSR